MERNHLSAGDIDHMKYVRSCLVKGDLITHECRGGFQEHYFIKFDGDYIIGEPTVETKKYSTDTEERIHPLDITHINRMKVDRQ